MMEVQRPYFQSWLELYSYIIVFLSASWWESLEGNFQAARKWEMAHADKIWWHWLTGSKWGCPRNVSYVKSLHSLIWYKAKEVLHLFLLCLGLRSSCRMCVCGGDIQGHWALSEPLSSSLTEQSDEEFQSSLLAFSSQRLWEWMESTCVITTFLCVSRISADHN